MWSLSILSDSTACIHIVWTFAVDKLTVVVFELFMNTLIFTTKLLISLTAALPMCPLFRGFTIVKLKVQIAFWANNIIVLKKHQIFASTHEVN